jgi:biopolymer transport protein ExbB/TolQ
MKLSAETRGVLRRYVHLAPIIGLGGTCVGMATAFRLIARGSESDSGVLGMSLSVSVGATLVMVVLGLAGCFLYERVKSSRAA